ncbi:MAG: cytochrome c peroxidase [Burkholderiaceae bacterium]|jgi:cytochrome c peroxidase
MSSRPLYRSPLVRYFLPLSGTRTALLSVLILSGCGGGGSATESSATSSPPTIVLSAAALLGQKIFSDTSLSASGQMACATCHHPGNAHAQSNELSVQLGGANQQMPGTRAVPSLRYLNLLPAFFLAKDGTPTAGFNRDGSAATFAEQARVPLLAVHEMANISAADLTVRLSKAAYVEEFRQVFGSDILNAPEQAVERLAFALQQYQKEDHEFFPFDAKYDQFLAGKVALNSAELRGLTLFNNPAKGNCAACHTSARGADGSSPLFTDFSYDNIGVPRNPTIPANADPAYFDLGLCGPTRTDLSNRADLCGAFKVPSLRNVTTRKVFFHNGRFTNLRDVLGFYVRRDTNPEEWYPRATDGSIDKFNDLPAAYRKNVNTSEAPYNRLPGMAPALSAQEIDDVITFLGTLNDGYQITP